MTKLRSEMTPAERDRANANARKYREKKYQEDPDGFREYKRAAQAERRAKLAPEQKQTELKAHRLQCSRLHRRHHPLPDKTARNMFSGLESTVPRALPYDVRADVVGNILKEVAEGNLLIRDALGSVKAHITKHFRENDTHKNVSLDASHPVTGHAWVENLDSETPHF